MLISPHLSSSDLGVLVLLAERRLHLGVRAGCLQGVQAGQAEDDSEDHECAEQQAGEDVRGYLDIPRGGGREPPLHLADLHAQPAVEAGHGVGAGLVGAAGGVDHQKVAPGQGVEELVGGGHRGLGLRGVCAGQEQDARARRRRRPLLFRLRRGFQLVKVSVDF
eukprot:CAMPEP_0194581946 /NCGR_PEP_ID=MMETSP0292-20121207/15261_2 /TAXON_ID=39354 /ORGANISM="Heterosigma akashiwo, Strain CCMP2393" /LENGTH=163 /DNA_ID=CAMNT_0039435903 /DNA_START=239 /DNA_END=730 /DNA_ORIENTATION=-